MKLKQTAILFCLCMMSTSIFAQSFDIGHTTTLFYDSIRSRNIEVEIYYPADVPGDNMPVAAGNFPVLIFGHGFLMSWDAYENFWTALVPAGYVICFPTTETGLMPSHGEFGLDLAFVATQMQAEGNDNTSLFWGALAPKTALMGHSMGGGASFLAADGDTTISALVNFAAAETNPSAIAAAAHITIPALLFSGDDDCVTPPSDHQNPMYDSLASACKTHISIIKGGHCYFAENNFSCTLGESFCNPTLDITREEQHDITFDFLKLWLDYSLNGNQQAFTVFNDSLQRSTRIQSSQSCNTTALQPVSHHPEIKLYPNPVFDNLNLDIPSQQTQGLLIIYNSMGRKVYQQIVTERKAQFNVSDLPGGTYAAVFLNGQFTYTRKFVKAGNR